jgi:hypothetical protein
MEADSFSKKLCFLGIRIPDNGQSPETDDPECYTPLSEPFRFHTLLYLDGRFPPHITHLVFTLPPFFTELYSYIL